jgi:hypothetical protein
VDSRLERFPAARVDRRVAGAHRISAPIGRALPISLRLLGGSDAILLGENLPHDLDEFRVGEIEQAPVSRRCE